MRIDTESELARNEMGLGNRERRRVSERGESKREGENKQVRNKREENNK